jgi:DNA-directed RNA polymerase sigma subunit (sigma70/sigma32)
MKARNQERDMYIYRQRKEGKRTFADIGMELGITGQRVREIYMRLDWKLNGMNADHRRNESLPPWLEVVKDPETGETIVIPLMKP